MIDINDLHSTYCSLCMKRAYSLVTEEAEELCEEMERDMHHQMQDAMARGLTLDDITV